MDFFTKIRVRNNSFEEYMTKSKPLLATLVVLLTTSSCGMLGKRTPASERDIVLSNIFSDVHSSLTSVSKDPKLCALQFSDLYKRLLNMAGVASYFDSTDIKSIDEDIQNSFETRLELKESFRNFINNSSDSSQCLNTAQDVARALRYIEDYLIELRVQKDTNINSEYINLMGEFPYLLVNPKYKDDFKSYHDLKSGDVILSRGGAYTSAAIARIAVSDYQFSHLSFVYKNPTTGELSTSEAHIEIGSVAAPIQAHLDEKNVRTVVFRYVDQDVAHRASEAIYKRIKKANESGKNIEYDFSMNYKDPTRLYCSEVVSAGFKLALPESDFFPKFKSNFSAGMIPFLNSVGVPLTKENVSQIDVFAPGDIQFDPNFELIAEWRNPKRLEESRYKDFILTKIFERMDKKGYEFDGNLKMDVQTKALWLLRRTPIVRKFLEKKFPLNMNPTQLEVFMMLDKIGDAIYKEIELKSIDFDHPMTPKEIYQVIDDFMDKDLEVYKKYKKSSDSPRPAFHLLFHP
jgi:hypothetical protein